MDDYLTKPIVVGSLLSALKKWLKPPEQSMLPLERAVAKTAVRSAPPLSVPGPSVFDRSGLMDRLMGDQDLALEVIEQFVADFPGQLLELRRLLGAGDAPGGAPSPQDQGRLRGGRRRSAVEQATKAGDLPAALAHIVEIDAEFEALRFAADSFFRGSARALCG
jgi:HPt (histidine-containing phosphotransfer) domain-containing protein